MSRLISMLRGINVSGQKIIRMTDVKNLYEGLGFIQVETYVQSGNVIFDSLANDITTLQSIIERQIANSFGFDVSVFIREPKEFRRVITANPFLTGRNEATARLYVTFLYDEPTETKLNQLVVPTGEVDELAAGDKEIFLYCPNGYGRTKLSNTFIERKLGVAATTRNWNTVLALYQMTQ